MIVDTTSNGFAITAGIRQAVERRVRFALGRYRDVVRSVRVRLRDLNGPRGGVDKTCQLEIALSGHPPLVIAGKDVDLYRAIGRAARRADQQVARRLHRAHSL